MGPLFIMVFAGAIGTIIGLIGLLIYVYFEGRKHPKDPDNKTYSLKDENKAFKLLKKE